ncbi:hypothetical protein [Shouchella lonarensis]|uniref:Uncharacterized protein n=1 Tax=Shouchella lonarensis TaxID=1464122 RepID=A0A1G6MNL0_9BACI|nr:hypothetical protein [Shouchella lonarensis]SDC56555.1 hypothetical protein SAMN05421737_11073 [Shouchella lonarensis]
MLKDLHIETYFLKKVVDDEDDLERDPLSYYVSMEEDPEDVKRGVLLCQLKQIGVFLKRDGTLK